MTRPSSLIISLGIILLMTPGCGQTPPLQPVDLSAVNERLINICKKDYNFEPVVKALKNTVWIYVPMKDPMVAIKASEAGPSKSDKREIKLTTKFLESSFVDNKFVIRYDIGMSDSYTKDPGYGLPYTEEYTAMQRNIIAAVGRAYSDVETLPAGRNMLVQAAGGQPTDHGPEFAVIVIADVLNGMESRFTVYLPDLLRGMSDQSFFEEYAKRLAADEIYGHDIIKGDFTGRHLDVKEMTWGDFLAKQILHRIRFKYTQSDFKPSGDATDEILAAVAQTTSAYSFTDFTSIELNDLADGKKYSFDQKQLQTFLRD